MAMQNTFTVTLTDADTNYALIDLVRAIDADFIDQGDFVFQADDDGGGQIYRWGDSNLSSTNGQTMLPGDFSPHFDALLNVYARCDTAAKKLNISRVGLRRV